MSDIITNEQARERELQLRDEHEALWHDLAVESQSEREAHSLFIEQQIAELDVEIERSAA
jgi:hypothetical protein